MLVHDFAVSERDVIEYQGFMRQQPSNKDPVDRRRQIAPEERDVLASKMLDGLRSLGFAVDRASRSAFIDMPCRARFSRGLGIVSRLRQVSLGFYGHVFS